MGKQWIVGVALGLGLTAGAIGARIAFQQRQLELTHQNQAVRAAVEASNNTLDEKATESTKSNGATVSNQSGRPSQFGQFTQTENDYLYDLSQALQPSEKAKMDAAGRLEIGRTVAGWAEAGAGYWELRRKFDTTYAATPSDREVYLKYAIERFAPAHTAVLIEPPSQPTAVPVSSEPTYRPEYIPAPIPRPISSSPIPESPILDKPIPGRPEVIPSPGKPPDDSTPGGSLIVAPEPPSEIVAPEEPEATPEPMPIPKPDPMPDPVPPPIPEPPLEAAPLPIGSEPEQG